MIMIVLKTLWLFKPFKSNFILSHLLKLKFNHILLFLISDPPSLVHKNLNFSTEDLDVIAADPMFQTQAPQQFFHLNCNLFPGFCPSNFRDFPDINMAVMPNVPMMNEIPKMLHNYQDAKSCRENPTRPHIDGFKEYFNDHCYAATLSPSSDLVDIQNKKEKLSEPLTQISNYSSLLSDHLPPMDNPSSIITPVGSSGFDSLSSFCDSLQNSDFDLKDNSLKDILMSDIAAKKFILNEDISLSKAPKVVVKKEPLDDLSDSFLLSRSFDSVVCE